MLLIAGQPALHANDDGLPAGDLDPLDLAAAGHTDKRAHVRLSC
jgi:hypothetical protein